MKTSENFKVNGMIEGINASGKITVYNETLNKIPKKSIIAGYRDNFKQFVAKFGTVAIYNKQKLKRVTAGILAGTIMLTSMTGCSLSQGKDKKIVDDPTGIVNVVEEEKQRVVYTVENGDNLSAIASLYCDSNAKIQEEVKSICKNNDIDNPNKIYPGMEISLWVPLSKLHVFGIIPQNEQTPLSNNENKDEVNEPKDAEKTDLERIIDEKQEEWDKKDFFVFDEWDRTKAQVENEPYKSAKEALFNIGESEINSGMRVRVSAKREKLRNMLDIPALYDDEKIQNMVDEIDGLYNKMVELTETTLGVNFEAYQENNSKTTVTDIADIERIQDDWISKEYFILDTWRNANVSSENELYKSNKETMFTNYRKDMDGGLYSRAVLEREALKKILDQQAAYGDKFYDSVNKKINEINGLYNQMLELTEITLGVTYGAPQAKTISK